MPVDFSKDIVQRLVSLNGAGCIKATWVLQDMQAGLCASFGAKTQRIEAM